MCAVENLFETIQLDVDRFVFCNLYYYYLFILKSMAYDHLKYYKLRMFGSCRYICY